MSGITRRIFTLIVLLALFGVVAAPHAAYAATPTTIVQVTDASRGWNVTFHDGTTLFVEQRVLETVGNAPVAGPVTNFVDQTNYLVAYGGYATFTQHGVTYHGYRL